MKEINDDDLSKVNGGQFENDNQVLDISTGKFLKNNTSDHYFMIKDDYGTDIGGISCWTYYDGTVDSNQNAILHKVDIPIYYHNIEPSLLPDWVKKVFNVI